MRKNYLLSIVPFLLCLFLTSTLSALTITWTGNGTNNRWSNPNNWDSGTVPGLNDDVIIPTGSGTVNFNFNNRRANSLHIEPGGQLTILNNKRLMLVNATSVSETLQNEGLLTVRGKLEVYSPDGEGIKNEQTIENFGSITIANCSFRALVNEGLVFNRPGAYFKFSNIRSTSIDNEISAQFINEGFIFFTNNTFLASSVINEGAFLNTNSGSMTMDGSTKGPISCLAGTFTNQGSIDFEWNPNRSIAMTVSGSSFINEANATFTMEGFIASALSVATDGLIENAGSMEISGNGIGNSIRCLNVSTNGVFTNKATGYLEFSASTGGATLWASNGRLNNFGAISIYDTTNGIISNGVVLNRSGAVIKIGDINLGISILETGFFGNIGGTVYCTGNSNNTNIGNTGFCRNFSCSSMFLDGRIAHSDGTFMNQGWIFNDKDGADHIATNALISNTGIITDPYDRFIAATQNNKARIPSLINPQANVAYPNAFDITSTAGLSITGLFLNVALTNSAGTYDLATNTYTPNNAAIGATKLYASTSIGGACSKVIQIRVDGGVLPIAGGEEEGFMAKKEESKEGESQNVKIYPNPSTGFFQVELPKLSQARGMLQITNAQGQLILSEPIDTDAERGHSFDLSEFPAGIYWMQLRNNGQIITQEKMLLLK